MIATSVADLLSVAATYRQEYGSFRAKDGRCNNVKCHLVATWVWLQMPFKFQTFMTHPMTMIKHVTRYCELHQETICSQVLEQQYFPV